MGNPDELKYDIGNWFYQTRVKTFVLFFFSLEGDDRVDGGGDGKPIENWEEVRERVEEGSTSGVSTINSNKSPKESMV